MLNKILHIQETVSRPGLNLGLIRLGTVLTGAVDSGLLTARVVQTTRFPTPTLLSFARNNLPDENPRETIFHIYSLYEAILTNS